MKILKKSVFLSLISFFLAGSAFAATAQVVAEDPDGGLILRSGATMTLDAGDLLQEGDQIRTRTATVVVSICDGALVTIYPDSEVIVSSLSDENAVLNLIKGELLGDTIAGCKISIGNKVDTTDISNGVYGVLLNQEGDSWTLQVRNLDGEVTFTGGNLLTGAATAILEAGKVVYIPEGEQLTVVGTFNPDSRFFTLADGSGTLSPIPPEIIEEMEEQIDDLRNVDPIDPGIPDMIEIPIEDVETASDQG